MTRTNALEKAKTNHTARSAEYIRELFRDPSNANLDAFDLICVEKYGYRHGWYLVDGFSFSEDEVTGTAYDHHQGGWAYV
jgi:hypothetical protein